MTILRPLTPLFFAIAAILCGNSLANTNANAIVIVPDIMRSQGEEAFVIVRDDVQGSRHYRLEQIKLSQKITATIDVTAASGRAFTLQARGTGLALMRLTDLRSRQARYFKIFVEHPDIEPFRLAAPSRIKKQRYELHFGTPPYQARLENDERPVIDTRTQTVRIPPCALPEQCPRYLLVQDALGMVVYKSLLPELAFDADLQQRRLDCEDALERNKIRRKKRALRHCIENASIASAN